MEAQRESLHVGMELGANLKHGLLAGLGDQKVMVVIEDPIEHCNDNDAGAGNP